MLNDLKREYQNKYNEIIELPLFLDLDKDEQIKILKECINKNQRIFENKYFNDTYMEEVERKE